MNKELIKDDFYKAVNGKWLEETVIPGDQPSISAFLELHLEIEKILMDLTKRWHKDQSGLNNNLKNYIKYYQMVKDFNKRTELGVKPAKPYFDKIANLNSLKDLEVKANELLLNTLNLPFTFNVTQDFKNSSVQVLYFASAGLFLPDTTYYQDESSKEQMLGLFKATSLNLLKLYGYNDEDANNLIDDAIKFDALLVPVTRSRVESADYLKMYNPVKREEIALQTKNFNVIKLAESLVNDSVDMMVVTNLDFLKAFDSIINESNFKIIKAWMLLKAHYNFSSLLTDEIRIVSGAFNRALSGIKEAQSQEKFAFYQAYNEFNQAVGLHYGENYFGPAAKKDVEVMVYEMIEVYKERIHNNTWLEAKTKTKAIKKLEHLGVHVGYPDELPKYYDQVNINGYSEGSNVLEERIKIASLRMKEAYAEYKKAPNKNIWGMPASMVNAYFNPTQNQIVFPAAILQKPYYSLKQSSSANYGGIGAVIAHEISHAFDNNGAKFDETGSLNNWWTEADLKAFKQKAQDMIALFDGVETGYGPCNGELTVSENIADSGGLRAAYEASKKSNNHSDNDFFVNWARVWRQKSSPEYAQLLLRVDVHGPSVLRANMQLSNMQEFQAYYQIEKADKMYLPKEKMVSIW